MSATEEQQVEARKKFELALNEYVSTCVDDSTAQVTAYLLQLKSSGAATGERTLFQMRGSNTDRLGLRDQIDHHVEKSVWGRD